MFAEKINVQRRGLCLMNSYVSAGWVVNEGEGGIKHRGRDPDTKLTPPVYTQKYIHIRI